MVKFEPTGSCGKVAAAILWYRKNGHNLEWLQGIAATGVHVTALDSKPEVVHLDVFYHRMFKICGVKFENVRTYCELHEMSKAEILEAFEIISLISSKVS